MENAKLIENIGQVLKKSRGEPSKLVELITCIRDLNQEGQTASYQKVVRKLWDNEWKRVKDRIKFEKSKWNLLRKRRIEINERVFNSPICFSFFIELSKKKQFKLLYDTNEIYSKRIEEFEINLTKEKSRIKQEKIKSSIIELTEKFKDINEEKAEKLSENKQKKSEQYDKPFIVVLPFINLSGDPEQEFFSDGITEGIINTLAKLEGLKIISRTSSFYFKGKDIDLRIIGEKLKVNHLLEGSVRKSGNKLRVIAHLINVLNDTHIWSETYDREMKDVFDVQDEISRAIVENLKLKLFGTRDKRLVKDYTQNTEVYELFLKGRYYAYNGMTDKALEYFEKTIEADPNYVPVYTYLARAYSDKSTLESWPRQDIFSKINELCSKAFELDNDYFGNYVLLGKIKMVQHYDWAGAEKAFKRAIDLNTGDVQAHFAYSQYLMAVGRIDEGIAEQKQTLELDPMSTQTRIWLGYFYILADQYNEAITILQEAFEQNHENPDIAHKLSFAYAGKGMFDKCITVVRPFKNISMLAARLGYVYGKNGNRAEAHKILDDLLERSRQGYISPYHIARVYSGLGDKNKAFEWLDKGYEMHDLYLPTIKVWPEFKNLHSDPKWKEQLRKRNLLD